MLDSPLQWMLDRRVLKNSLEHATFAAPIALASVGITRVSLKGKPLYLERFEARASMYVSFANEKECYFLQNTFVASISCFTRRYI